MARDILFVDTDNFMLKALRRVFRREQQWRVHYADGAQAALEILATHPIKIIFTEIPLADASGLDLLGQVQSRYPDVVRIILSGYTSQDVLVESVGVAHQTWANPVMTSNCWTPSCGPSRFRNWWPTRGSRSWWPG
jgi:DNA-binding NtrC family response regulator